MRYATLFSGIEAASLAVEPLGWEPAWFAEVDPFCNALLAHRYPDVPNLGDVSAITPAMIQAHGPVDVVIAGFPCQDLSVAGLRGGLAGHRSGLFFELVRICHELRPAVLVWENVPGLLSSNRGRDFGAVLMAMDRLGFDGAWTSLDAQWFGVAQRRQRVFGVFARRDIGATRCAEILALTTRMHGYPPTRRETGEDVAGTLTGGAATGRSHGKRNGSDRQPLVPTRAHSLNAHEGRNEPTSETLVPYTFDWQAGSSGDTSFQGKARSWIVDKPGHTRALTRNRTLALATPTAYQCQGTNVGEMGTLRQGNGHLTGGVPFVTGPLQGGNGHTSVADGIPNVVAAVAFDLAQITSAANRTRVAPELPASTLNGSGAMHVASPMAVRRLTPRECERLMGLPDDWTLVPYHGKPASDGPRYKAIGNSIAVPVLAWIAQRIDEV